MLEAVANGTVLWLRNIPLLSALVLTVWLPGNIAMNYAAAQSPSEEELSPVDFWLPVGIETLFGPLYAGAIIYALDQRRQNRRVGYFESFRVGFKFWGRLFWTELIADLLIALGILVFIIPGVVAALRYALVAMPVILEDESGGNARARSAKLMEGRKLAVLGFAVVFYSLFGVLMGVLYIPLELVYEATEMTDLQYFSCATVLDCFIDLTELPVLAIMYCVYVQASGRDQQPSLDAVAQSDTDWTQPLPADDGNPYQSPHTD